MFKGAMAICASGPSLCHEDIRRLHDNNIQVITVNSSWVIYPECQYIFAGDGAWWDKYHHLINSPAQKWTRCKITAQKYGIHCFSHRAGTEFNSGLMAILFAISLGAEDIFLLGYDCSLKRGIHWHGKHNGLNNPTDYSIRRWETEFQTLASEILRRVNIVNCSPDSRLTCFPVASLEKTLQRITR